MFRYRYILRNDNDGNAVTYTEAEVETEESQERFLSHAHVVEILEITDLSEKKPEVEKTEIKKKK